jgi:hypothetical protein
MSDLESRRAARRAAMPTVSAIVAELSAQFPSLKVIYACENGIVVGVKPCNENAFQIPPNYFPMWSPEKKEPAVSPTAKHAKGRGT